MKKKITTSLLLLGILLASRGNMYAQTDCGCANTTAPQKYKGKVDAGQNVQVCSQCAYMALYLCMCECGTTNVKKEELEANIRQIGKTLADLHRQGVGVCCPEYEGLTKSCPNAGKKKDGAAATGNGNKTAASTTPPPPPPSFKAAELNQGLVNFANSLSQFTDDPDAKKMVKDMNDLHTGISMTKDIFTAGGLGDKTNEFFDVAETVAQGAIILSKLFKKKEVELTEGQKNAIKYIGYLNEKVFDVYKNLATMPAQKSYDQVGLNNITTFEERINSYDETTAMQRLLILKYMEQAEIPELSTLQKWAGEIQGDYNDKGFGYIRSEIDRLMQIGKTNNTVFRYIKSGDDNSMSASQDNAYNLIMGGEWGKGERDFLYLRNADQSLKSAKAEALLFKAQYYFKTGDEAKANEIMDQLTSIAQYEDLKNGILAAFDQKNYKMAAQFYPIFFAQWYKKVNTAADNSKYQEYMKDVPVVSKGIVSLTKNNQHTNAAAHLEQVYTVYNKFLAMPKKKSKYSTPEFGDKETEKIFFNHAEAEILQKQGKYAEALQRIDSAIYYAETKTQMFVSNDAFYVYRLKETKIDLLINMKSFDKALSECASVQRNYSAAGYGAYAGNNYDAANIKFLQAVVFYNMGKYQPALNTLTVIKSMNESIPKVYMLEKEIYTAMNDLDAAKKAEEKINQLYNK